MNKAPTPSVHYITIEPDFAGQRIDNFLITYLKTVPKSMIYRILRKGEVRVNKKRVEPSYRLQADDYLRLPPIRQESSPNKPAPFISPEKAAALAERILYEDNSLLIINKPSGLAVHGGSGVKVGLIDALRILYPKCPHLELAHRLDADTSGCLILAKKRSVLKELHELLRRGDVRKVYWALTQGHWETNELIVDAPLQKNHLSSGERIVKVHKEGKPSLTVFEPITVFTDSTLVAATLHTGRTHQIRVHAQYRHHPIAGDEKYGDREFTKRMRDLGVKRLFLHSHLVEFTLPSTGQTIKITAPLDIDLEKALANLT